MSTKLAVKAQLGLVGISIRCQSCRGTARGGFLVLRQISRWSHTTTTFRPVHNIAPSRPNSVFAGPWRIGRAGRTTFSTSSLRRVPDGENPPAAAGEAQAGGKAAYPERLIIYHAGTGKTTFLACLKVTTLFLFGFFDMIMTPAYFAAGEPLVKTAGVALCGLIPAVYVAWSTSPFVAAMHLHLPPYARWSRAILERFARTAPPNTRLDVTTMSLIGKPRVSSMVLSDLRPANGRWGMVNYERDTALADARRRWWRFRAVSEFNVQAGGEKGVKTGWVWSEVKEGIARRAAEKGR